MKAVILAGGLGTRLSEETGVRPKPMVEIGGKPILWHVMKIYSTHGVNDFVICCGYKGYMIKEYFANYALHNSDVTFDIVNGTVTIHKNESEPWKITLVDSGVETMTGGRLRRVREYLGNEPFCFTYGDGLSDINITELIKFHEQHGKLATVSVIQPPGRFGIIQLSEGENIVHAFKEKPTGDGGGWINGGYFILDPKVIDYIAEDSTTWEQEPMMRLAHEGQLMAYRHNGFWHPMDTLRDKQTLEKMWTGGKAPWKAW